MIRLKELVTEDKYAKSKDIEVKVYNTFKKQPEYKQPDFIQKPGYYDITVTFKSQFDFDKASTLIKNGGPINSFFMKNKKVFGQSIGYDHISKNSLKKQYPNIKFRILSGSGDQTLQQLYADKILQYFTAISK